MKLIAQGYDKGAEGYMKLLPEEGAIYIYQFGPVGGKERRGGGRKRRGECDNRPPPSCTTLLGSTEGLSLHLSLSGYRDEIIFNELSLGRARCKTLSCACSWQLGTTLRIKNTCTSRMHLVRFSRDCVCCPQLRTCGTCTTWHGRVTTSQPLRFGRSR